MSLEQLTQIPEDVEQIRTLVAELLESPQIQTLFSNYALQIVSVLASEGSKDVNIVLYTLLTQAIMLSQYIAQDDRKTSLVVGQSNITAAKANRVKSSPEPGSKNSLEMLRVLGELHTFIATMMLREQSE